MTSSLWNSSQNDSHEDAMGIQDDMSVAQKFDEYPALQSTFSGEHRLARLTLRTGIIIAMAVFALKWWWLLPALNTILSSLVSSALVELGPFKFTPLPLGSIQPSGWLEDQMRLMADGLAGHQHDFYRFVSESSWIGGDQEYSDLHEGFPYWFNGIVPLAYGLHDARLKVQVDAAVTAVLERRGEDGWLGPEKGNARNFWARYPLFLGLVQLLEADMNKYAADVLPSMHDFVLLMSTMLRENGTGYIMQKGEALSEEDHNWARIRVADMMISLQWLYEHHPGGQEDILMDNMHMLLDGAINWADWYQEGVYIKQDLSTVPDSKLAPLFPYLHGVNVGQGLKAGAVINRFTQNQTMVDMARRAVNWTFTFHGASSGTILADERLQGLGPYSGSELCTTVETMYSLAYLYQALGDNEFADKAELAAFNALPAALTPDWWAHQYVTEPNQPYAKHLDDSPFWNVNNLGQAFGLEPNYPCCTVNHPQGYPKFLSNSWVRVGDYGLAHVLLGPAQVATQLGGQEVTVLCETKYPFDMKFQYTVISSKDITLYVRIPAWALSTSTMAIASSSRVVLQPHKDTGLQQVRVPSGVSSFILNLDYEVCLEHRANDTIAVYAGPLLYALELNYTMTSTPATAFNPEHNFTGALPEQARDHTFTNTSPWNVAIDPLSLSFHTRDEIDLQNPVWAPGALPMWIEGKACEIEWGLWKGVPGPVPLKAERKCIGEVRYVRLVPYGSAKVHMAELPTLDLGK